MEYQLGEGQGDVVMNDIEARWAGYVGQGVQPMFIGRVDSVWHDIFQTCQEILAATYEVTVFRDSQGGWGDLALAQRVLAMAKEAGLGKEVSF